MYFRAKDTLLPRRTGQSGTFRLLAGYNRAASTPLRAGARGAGGAGPGGGHRRRAAAGHLIGLSAARQGRRRGVRRDDGRQHPARGVLEDQTGASATSATGAQRNVVRVAEGAVQADGGGAGGGGGGAAQRRGRRLLHAVAVALAEGPAGRRQRDGGL